MYKSPLTPDAEKGVDGDEYGTEQIEPKTEPSLHCDVEKSRCRVIILKDKSQMRYAQATAESYTYSQHERTDLVIWGVI